MCGLMIVLKLGPDWPVSSVKAHIRHPVTELFHLLRAE